ncbi:MAG: capsular polysaccharide biosynthesis protein [Pseudomonadota bacterium]|nr:capsular polysaccharide biosynthesis protein [Pseudomonadota bacterium]
MSPGVTWGAAPLPRFAATLVSAPGVAALTHLESFLPECAALVRSLRPTREVDSVAGWGFKPTARYARRLAAARGWPYLALEDGFLRSVGLGESGAPPISLVADDLGIYYDARSPSRLETLLESTGWEDEILLARARSAMARLVESGLSKTNAAPPLRASVLERTGRRRVLVVDQTAGDASIVGGMADAATFTRMLEAARCDEGDAQIVVRRHPAVAAGLKRGCLPAGALAGAVILDEDCRIADILERVDGVYTVSSLTGFEALIRGLPVRCFGLPFYAGWGATTDEITSTRRTRRRAVEEIFAAAYLLYARYIDPLSGEPSDAERAIERLVEFRDRSDRHAGYTACLGYAPWKHGSGRTLLYSPRGETAFFSRATSAVKAARRRGGRVVFWAGRETPALTAALETGGAPVLRMEDGFIRSRGLGSDFHRAASVVLDDLGVYYDATRPSRLETILQTGGFDAATLARAAALRARLVAAGLSKYNLWTDRAPPSWPIDRFKLLVVGQVENDKSIVKGCADVRDNLALLRAARAVHPDAFIVFKPHPDVEAGNRVGAVPPHEVAALADAEATGADIDVCLSLADGVATMTSLAGFEALLRGKPVWTFGRPFFAGWGLTHDSLDFPRRGRTLTLDELVVGTLIAYPIYIHPPTGLPCGPEDLVAFLEHDRLAAPDAGPRRLRYFRAVWESLRRQPKARY